MIYPSNKIKYDNYDYYHAIIYLPLVLLFIFQFNILIVFAENFVDGIDNKSNTRLNIAWSQEFYNDILIIFSSSTDGGKTFSNPINISNYNGIFGFPSMIDLISHEEKVQVASETDRTGNSEIFFSSSTDGGKTFSDPINVSNNTGTSSSPALALYDNITYIVWSDNSNGNSEIFFSSSTDGGKTFDDPINISNNKGDSGDPEITSKNGKIYVLWRDDLINPNANPVYFNNGVFFSSSTDGGKTFSNPINISGNNINSREPAMTLSNSNNIYIIWNEATNWRFNPDIRPMNHEIFFSSSTDGGKTFSNPINISNDRFVTSIPKIAVSSDNIYIIAEVSREIVLYISTDGGKTFSDLINISNNTGKSGFPEISTFGNTTYIIWQDNTTLNSEDLLNDKIFFSSSTDGGKTFSNPINISNYKKTSSFPKVNVP